MKRPPMVYGFTHPTRRKETNPENKILERIIDLSFFHHKAKGNLVKKLITAPNNSTSKWLIVSVLNIHEPNKA